MREKMGERERERERARVDVKCSRYISALKGFREKNALVGSSGAA